MKNVIETKPLAASYKGDFLFKGERMFPQKDVERVPVSAALKDMLGASDATTTRVVAG